MDLFKPGAPWVKAASRVHVFKFYGQFLDQATDSQLKQAVDGLNRLGIAIAMEAGPLVPSDTCGGEGFGGPQISEKWAQRIKAAGGVLRYIAMDEPFAFGSITPDCQWTAEKVAQEVADYIRQLRSVFPEVVVGDIEPVWEKKSVGDFKHWLETYRFVTGEDLPFFILDFDWLVPDWPEAAKELESFCRERGIEFGMIYFGNFDDSTDEAWLRHAEERMVIYERQYGGRPDYVFFQSWHPHPNYLLPEADPTKFTNLINRYFRNPTVLSSQMTPSSPFGAAQVTGTLLDQAGSPVTGAPIQLTARPLDGPGNYAEYRMTGTVPAGATQAEVGFRVNTDCGCSGPSDFALYQARYTEGPKVTTACPIRTSPRASMAGVTIPTIPPSVLNPAIEDPDKCST